MSKEELTLEGFMELIEKTEHLEDLEPVAAYHEHLRGRISGLLYDRIDKLLLSFLKKQGITGVEVEHDFDAWSGHFPDNLHFRVWKKGAVDEVAENEWKDKLMDCLPGMTAFSGSTNDLEVWIPRAFFTKKDDGEYDE